MVIHHRNESTLKKVSINPLNLPMLTKNQMMFKNLFLIIAILPFSIFSQEVTDSVKINRILDQVNVNALRANKQLL